METIIWTAAFFLSPLFIYTSLAWFPFMFCFAILSGSYFKKNFQGTRTPFMFVEVLGVSKSTGRTIGLIYSLTAFGMAYLLSQENGQLGKLGLYTIFIGIMMLIGVLGSINEKN